MPELPEVETIRRQIEPLISKRTISTVDTIAHHLFFITQPAVLKRGLIGRRVESLHRFGKYLLWALEGGYRLLLHLGMSGQLYMDGIGGQRHRSQPANQSYIGDGPHTIFKIDKHTHLCIGFGGTDMRLHFRDVRKFGRVQLLRPNESCDRLNKLGIDAMQASSEDLFGLTRRRKVVIKNLLLDQSVLAGIGNIYADEALFISRIHPARVASRLSRIQCKRLIAAIQQVLTVAIENGGSSIINFIHPDGKEGGYQNKRLVYARKNQPCVNCSTSIKCIIIGQRSTHYCPKCQRLK